MKLNIIKTALMLSMAAGLFMATSDFTASAKSHSTHKEKKAKPASDPDCGTGSDGQPDCTIPHNCTTETTTGPDGLPVEVTSCSNN